MSQTNSLSLTHTFTLVYTCTHSNSHAHLRAHPHTCLHLHKPLGHGGRPREVFSLLQVTQHNGDRPGTTSSGDSSHPCGLLLDKQDHRGTSVSGHMSSDPVCHQPATEARTSYKSSPSVGFYAIGTGVPACPASERNAAGHQEMSADLPGPVALSFQKSDGQTSQQNIRPSQSPRRKAQLGEGSHR